MMIVHRAAAAAVVAGLVSASTATCADPLGYAGPLDPVARVVEQILPNPSVAMHRQNATTEVASRLRRRIVAYVTREAPGTIVIDTPNTYLYLVLGNGRAIRYGIGVGREGFTWAGVKHIDRKAEWPDWTPTAQMLVRQPYLPRFMAGGRSNPLGARAMYLGGTVYRIHGTNDPSTIGKRVSSGCIRLVNDDVKDLYARVASAPRLSCCQCNHATRRACLPKAARFRICRAPRSSTPAARTRSTEIASHRSSIAPTAINRNHDHEQQFPLGR